MKTWLWRGALVLTLLGMLGGLVMLSGIVPIKASSGHWAITAWLLNFSKQRSVSTHTLGVKPPPLDDPRMVVKGGAYYDIGCRPCHGSPELRQPRIAARMTPPPVYLPPRIANWEAEELFYMIKHGIKFTGMPAWPAPGRDDEVWAIVAFLKRLPILNAAEYARVTRGETADDGMDAPLRALAAKSVAARRAVSENCSRCHGADGMGRDGASPVIAGQQAAYIFATLERLWARPTPQRHDGTDRRRFERANDERTWSIFTPGLRPLRDPPVPKRRHRARAGNRPGRLGAKKSPPLCGVSWSRRAPSQSFLSRSCRTAWRLFGTSIAAL